MPRVINPCFAGDNCNIVRHLRHFVMNQTDLSPPDGRAGHGQREGFPSEARGARSCARGLPLTPRSGRSRAAGGLPERSEGCPKLCPWAAINPATSSQSDRSRAAGGLPERSEGCPKLCPWAAVNPTAAWWRTGNQ